MRIRGRRVRKDMCRCLLVVVLFQVFRVLMVMDEVAEELSGTDDTEDASRETFGNRRVDITKSSTMPPTMHMIMAPPTMALTTILPGVLCPDMKAHEERALGQRLLGGQLRNILAQPWGDPNLKKKNLDQWNKEIALMIKSKRLQLSCEKDMTFTKLEVGNITSSSSAAAAAPSYCPCLNERMLGNTEIEWSPPSWAVMAETYGALGVAAGGTWRPSACTARQKLAIIIPYKDRLNHLHVLLHHLHKILLRQDMHYRVFVVEQAHPNIFNKAALMDVAFLEANNVFPDFDCVLFHDVDLLLEDDRNVYGCVRGAARHVASHTDKHAYKLPYTTLFGGSTAFPADVFRSINGYGTSYWGWGGEDDDMFARVRRILRTKPTVHRQTKALARFTMMKHERDHLSPLNIYKNRLLKNTKGFMASQMADGLSSIQYTVHATLQRPLYTWILAEAHSPLTQFFYREGVCDVTQKQPYTHNEWVLLMCATKCQDHAHCQMFQFKYDPYWHPWCSLFTADCTQSNSTTVTHSFIFTKGRSAGDKIRSDAK